MKIVKDEIFFGKRVALTTTISYLKAIKQSLPRELAIKIADLAASNYMISYYEKVLAGTKPGSHERFDQFRKHYEAYPQTSPYCEIISSDTHCLAVKFKRCPYAEVLYDEGLFVFASSSCSSDISFTLELLPGVDFKRESSIINGNNECIMKWSRSL